MAKKHCDEKILLMTDTASDISDEDLIKGGIVMLPIPLAIDGKGYLERVDFTTAEFYERLARAKELPSTSHILSPTYEQAYQDALEQGYTHVINVTITSKGSNMFGAAVQAKIQFYRQNPEALEKMQITVLDSGSYSLGYGYPIVEASKKIAAGKSAGEIVAYLDDFFSRTEIVFAVYSLEYAKKSGRIPAAAAFVGDVLGLRPIISIIDGVTTVTEKVRGDKNVIPRVVEYAYGRAADKKCATAVVTGSLEGTREEISKAISKRFGGAPRAFFQAGAAITINSGPKVVGMIIQGEKRLGTRAREQDYLQE